MPFACFPGILWAGVSDSLCVGLGRVCVEFNTIHVSVLQYSEACSYSPMRSRQTSIFEGLHDFVRMRSGSLEGLLPPRTGSSSFLAQFVHDLASKTRNVPLRASVARDRARPVHTG